MKKYTVEIIFALLLIAMVVNGYFGIKGSEEKNKAMIEKVDSVIDSLKAEIDNSNKKLADRIDSIKVINQNKTIIKNNYIGVSNEVDNINDVDSVANYIRGWLSKLHSPNFD